MAKLDDVLVCTGGRISDRPPPELPDGLRVEEMDLTDRYDIERWLLVHNDAFGRNICVPGYRASMVDHPHYDLRRALFLLDERGPVGCAAAGVFRRNEDMGVPHYIAVTGRAKGKGHGAVLGALQARAMFELGVTHAETESQISRTASLCLQFSFGWEPKYVPDQWNTPDTASPLARSIANARLRLLHRRWAKSHAATRAT